MEWRGRGEDGRGIGENGRKWERNRI